jgi:hypothetical protein
MGYVPNTGAGFQLREEKKVAAKAEAKGVNACCQPTVLPRVPNRDARRPTKTPEPKREHKQRWCRTVERRHGFGRCRYKGGGA